MCVVSYTNNFIFFHIPKCGGTSINDLIGDLRFNEPSLINTHHTYLDAKRIFEEKGMLDWFNNAKKFAVVRNPFDMMASLYKYIKEKPNHYLHKRILNHDFTQFCYYVRNVGDKGIKTQYEYLQNEFGEIEQSIKIFKLEEINKHLRELSNIIGKPIKKIPKTNSTSYYYKKTTESNWLIADFCRKDFERLYSEIL